MALCQVGLRGPLHQAAPQARIASGSKLSAALPPQPPGKGFFESPGQFTLLESLTLWLLTQRRYIWTGLFVLWELNPNPLQAPSHTM